MLSLVNLLGDTTVLISGFHSFNDLAWTESDDNSRGVIAGALNSGSLDLWDADKLLSGARFVVLPCYVWGQSADDSK